MKLIETLTLGAAAFFAVGCGETDSLGESRQTTADGGDTEPGPRGGGGTGTGGKGSGVGGASAGGSANHPAGGAPSQNGGATGEGGIDCRLVDCNPAISCPDGQQVVRGECCWTCGHDAKCAAVLCAQVDCARGSSRRSFPGECCARCVPDDCAAVSCPTVDCGPDSPGAYTPPGECCPQCLPPSAPSDAGGSSGMPCLVDGKTYRSGQAVKDPFSCNNCVCHDGKLDVCTEIGCPVPCPAGTIAGSRCAECGLAGGCMGIETGCLPSCTQSADCGQPGQGCYDGVCVMLCL